MKTIRFTWVILFVLLVAKSAHSQEIIFFEGDFKPLVVWVYPERMQKEVTAALRTLGDYKRKEYQFLFVRDSLSSKESVCQKINDFLNDERGIDKQRIYYLEWGKGSKSEYFSNSNTDILADVYFHSLEDNSQTFNLLKVLERFDNRYIWESTLYNIETNNLTTIPKLRKLGFGLTYGKSTQSSFENDTAFLPSAINKLGITLSYRLNPRLYLTGRTMFSFKIPNQSKMQAQLFSQIDPFAGGVQTISINMKSHIFLESSFYAQYFLTDAKKLKPFVAAGFAFSTWRSAKINEEVEIDFDNIFSGGGMGDFGDLAGGGELAFFTVRNFNPLITAGASYQLSRNVSFLLSTEYQFNSREKANGIKLDNRYQNFSINAGIQFELSKKQKKYYQYLKPI
jgi:hypothetical protein